VLGVAFVIFLVLVLAVAIRASSAEERARLLRLAVGAIREVKDVATRQRPESERFHEALRARTRWSLVTPALVALNVGVFVSGDPAALGNFAPHTTNGEWWRLATSMFVHSGLVQLLVNVAGLVPVGLIVERLVGRLAFAAVYLAAGVLASLVSLWEYPVAVSLGASGAIFGIYGLLLASWIYGLLRRSDVTIPWAVLKRLTPAAAVFVLYNVVANDSLPGAAELTGLAVGILGGVALARHADDRSADVREVASAAAVAAVIAVAAAVLLRGVADVKPEIDRVVALEDRTAGAYLAAADQYKNGRMTAGALIQVIDRTIMPELQSALTHLKALEKVPPEHQGLVADAEEFLHLRYESWRLRADGLRRIHMPAGRDARKAERASEGSSRLRAEAQYRANMLALGKAEGTERAALEVLQRLKPAGGN